MLKNQRVQSLIVLLGLGFGVALLAACATVRTPQLEPFSRAVLQFYDARQRRRGINDALLWLELEPGRARSVVVRAFDDKKRPLAIDRSDVIWTGSENLKLEPGSGSLRVKVVLLGGTTGRLRVNAGNHSGEIRIKRKGE
jgi:hypothetical protein